MLKSAFLAVLVALSIVVQECNVGDLLDLLVTYQVSVHNASAMTAFVSVATQSSSRDATLPPGATAVARSFKPGRWGASVGVADPALNDALLRLRDNLKKLWTDKTLTPAQVDAIRAQNASLREVFKQRNGDAAAAASAACGGAMEATDPPKDQEVVLEATFANGKWSLSC